MEPTDPATMPAGDAETRIAILADVISRVLRSPEPVLHRALFKSALEATGRAEEDVGLDIHAAISVCVFSGLSQSESFIERDDACEFNVGADTTLRPSRWATRFVWRDEYYDPPDDEPPDRIA